MDLVISPPSLLATFFPDMCFSFCTGQQHYLRMLISGWSGNSADSRLFKVLRRRLFVPLQPLLWSSLMIVSRRYIRGRRIIVLTSCASIIMVFSNLAIQSKRKVPNAHTFLGVLRVRYGTVVHLSLMFFSLATTTVSSFPCLGVLTLR